jgi:C-terminal processing protease CtpA/Prc
VLKRFRLEVDWPNRMTYWEAGPARDDHDLDIVGLTLRPEPDGGFTVAGVATRDGRATVEGVEPGDRLVRVDSLEAAGTPMGEIEDALRGSPGEMRTLVLDREGRSVTIEARVTRFP